MPGMKCNLFSVEQLVEKGFSVVMKKETFELFDAHKRLSLSV